MTFRRTLKSCAYRNLVITSPVLGWMLGVSLMQNVFGVSL